MISTPLRLHCQPFAAVAAPFLEEGLLALTDVYVVDHLARLVDERDAEVLLGLAFAVRAPRVGHVGVDLATIRATIRDERLDDDDDTLRRRDALSWPDDAEDWHTRACASGLVGDANDALPHPFVHGARLLKTRRYHAYERRLAKALVRRAEGDEPGVSGGPLDLLVLRRGLDSLFRDADPMQRMGALTAILRPLAVVTGGPGTGKTFTVKSVLALLHAQWTSRLGRPPRVALAAPTGKAAVRMVQAVRERVDTLGVEPAVRDWLLALQATTIHRLLGWNPKTPSRFRHGLERQLPYDIVVVDETSMVDLALMCKLVEAVRDDARLVLLGDPDQLASIEAGSVLADLTCGARQAPLRVSAGHAERLREIDPCDGLPLTVHSPLPRLADGLVHFRRSFRFAAESGIGRIAAEMTDGGPGWLDRAAAWLEGRSAQGRGPFADVSFVPHSAGAGLAPSVLATIVDRYRDYLSMLLRGPIADETEPAFHGRVLAALDRFRVLAAHRRGPLGVAGLNDAIEKALAADARTDLRVGGASYVGRPVLITENSYEVGRMNGDVGVVVGRGQGAAGRVAFPGAKEGAIDYLDLGRMPPHQTVFAMTIHKSQGSQFEEVVIVLPDRPSPVVSHDLIYTALTRASKSVTIAGPIGQLRAALARRAPRASELGEALWPNGDGV